MIHWNPIEEKEVRNVLAQIYDPRAVEAFVREAKTEGLTAMEANLRAHSLVETSCAS